jgi:hypothetical protein
MIEKQEIIIKQLKATYGGFKIFNISFGEMQFLISGTFDLFAFNNENSFSKLIKNFKEKDKVCYLLFRALTWPEPGAGGARIEDIKEALSLSSSYFTLNRADPGESRLLKRLGEEMHFLMLKDNVLLKMQRIMNYIDSKGTWCFFIFAAESQKDNLFFKIDKLYRSNALTDQRNLLALCLDIIKFGSQGLWAEYELEIFTNRYDAAQIKELILNSTNKEKFEVVLK